MRAAFECRRCTFDGDILARHVIFDREIDLGGITINGRLDLRGATFTKPVALGTGPRNSHVTDRADLTGATFAALVDVGGAKFDGGVVFRFTRFRDDVFFNNVTFSRPADFRGAVFDGRARFDAATFYSGVSFSRALFGGGVDFGGTSFVHRAVFKSTEFRGQTNFTGTTFVSGTSFEEAHFRNGATFNGALFSNAPSAVHPSLDLGSVVAQDDLNFQRARIGGSRVDAGDGHVDIRADNVVASGLNFESAEFGDGMAVSLTDSGIRDLRFPLEDLGHVVDEVQRGNVLSLVENWAKRHDEIGLANDAHYRHQVLNAQDYGLILEGFDAVFYRGMAGYFVRPLRPLVVLGVFVLAFALGRRVRTTGFHFSGLRAAGRWIVSLGREIWETLALAIPHPGGGQTGNPLSMGRRLEVFTYRILFVCALIGLANTNPTLRNMIDTLT